MIGRGLPRTGGGFARALVAASAWLALGACGDRAGEALDAMKAYRARMCACTAPSCAEAVAKEVTAWLGSVRTTKPTKTQEDEMSRVADELTACRRKAMAGHPEAR